MSFRSSLAKLGSLCTIATRCKERPPSSCTVCVPLESLPHPAGRHGSHIAAHSAGQELADNNTPDRDGTSLVRVDGPAALQLEVKLAQQTVAPASSLYCC